MNLYEGLLTRRSIRNYSDESISREKLEQIIKAGMYAPSAVNKQPWHFMVIDEKAVHYQLMEVHPYASMLEEAPAAILVCGDDRLHNGPGYWAVDCAAATQNILLAAHSFGLGSVWIGIHPREERKKAVKQIMNLPGHIHPFALVALGMPAEEVSQPDRFKKERIYYNQWGVGNE